MYFPVFLKKSDESRLLEGLLRIIGEVSAFPLAIEMKDEKFFREMPEDGAYVERADKIFIKRSEEKRANKLPNRDQAIQRFLENFKPLCAKEVHIIGRSFLAEAFVRDCCEQNVRHCHVYREDYRSKKHPNDQVLYQDISELKPKVGDLCLFVDKAGYKSWQLNKLLGRGENALVTASIAHYREDSFLGESLKAERLEWLMNLLIPLLEDLKKKRMVKPLRDKIYAELREIDLTSAPIFLIGLPAVGKSSVGQALAKFLNYGYYDLDKAMMAKTGLSITELYDQDEKAYRDLEAKLLQQLGQRRRAIISTGNGAILRPESRDYLLDKFVVHLDRPQEWLDEGVSTRNRPLLRGNPGLVKHLRKERHFYYHSVSNCRVVNYHRIKTAKLLQELIQQRQKLQALIHREISRLSR